MPSFFLFLLKNPEIITKQIVNNLMETKKKTFNQAHKEFDSQ